MPLDTTVVALIGTATTLTAATLGPFTTRRLARLAARREWSQRASEAYAAGRRSWSLCGAPVSVVEAGATVSSPEERDTRITHTLDATNLLRASSATAPTPEVSQLAEDLAERVEMLGIVYAGAMNLGILRQAQAITRNGKPSINEMRADLEARRSWAMDGADEDSPSLEALFEMFRAEISREHWSRRRWRTVGNARASRQLPDK